MTCLDAKATCAEVSARFSQYDFSLVLAGGHGDDDRFEGADGRPIWRAEDSLDELAGVTVYLLACSTARLLGPRIAARGARAFWGYSEGFLFPTTPAHPDPARDPLAAPFLEMAAQVDLGLLAGEARDAVFGRVEHLAATVFNDLADLESQFLFYENYTALRCIEGGTTYGAPVRDP